MTDSINDRVAVEHKALAGLLDDLREKVVEIEMSAICDHGLDEEVVKVWIREQLLLEAAEYHVELAKAHEEEAYVNSFSDEAKAVCEIKADELRGKELLL